MSSLTLPLRPISIIWLFFNQQTRNIKNSKSKTEDPILDPIVLPKGFINNKKSQKNKKLSIIITTTNIITIITIITIIINNNKNKNNKYSNSRIIKSKKSATNNNKNITICLNKIEIIYK